MTEGFPDNGELIEHHPDIGDLRGPDPGIHPHLDADASANLSVTHEARVLVDLDAVPVDGILTVTVLDGKGEAQELSFVRGPQPKRPGPSWRIRIPRADGTFSEELAEVRGSGIIGRSWLRMGQVCEGLDLEYTVVRMIRAETKEDLPDDSYWKPVFVPITKLSDKDIEDGLELGFIKRDEKGALQWNLPYASEMVTGPVINARVTYPNPEGSPPTA